MAFCAIFALCVVLKCQYFWSYSRKTYFLPYTPILSRAITHSNCVRLTWFSFLCVQEIPMKFFCYLSCIIFQVFLPIYFWTNMWPTLTLTFDLNIEKFSWPQSVSGSPRSGLQLYQVSCFYPEMHVFFIIQAN